MEAVEDVGGRLVGQTQKVRGAQAGGQDPLGGVDAAGRGH